MLPSIIYSTSPTVIIRPAQIMNPYCKEGGLGAQLSAPFHVITVALTAFSPASYLLRSIHPPDSSQPFSGYWS